MRIVVLKKLGIYPACNEVVARQHKKNVSKYFRFLVVLVRLERLPWLSKLNVL